MTTRQVLYLSPLPPPAGGIANWTRILMERGLPQGWRATLVDTRSETPVFTRGLARADLGQLKRWSRIVRELRHAIRADRPDLIHINTSLHSAGMFRDVICAQYATNKRIPYVIHYRGDVPVAGDTNVASRHFLQRLARNASLNLVLNVKSKEIIRELAGTQGRVVQIPNYYDDRALNVAGPALLTARQRPQAIFVGGLTRSKGAHRVLAAAAKLPWLDFLLVGQPYREVITSETRLPENVELAGELPHAEVLSLLAASHVFLFPTHHAEGFPNVVCEAMASALPVLSCARGAIDEMINDGQGGRILHDREVETLTESLEFVFADEPRRQQMGRHNLAKAQRLYSYTSVIAELTTLYGQVLDR